MVWQCMKAGLVGGEKIHVDASLVDANASKNSVVKGPPELIEELKKRSFADAAVNHGFKRSRWRRLDKQRIQDYLIATVQNIRILLKSTTLLPRLVVAQESALGRTLRCVSVPFCTAFSSFQTIFVRSLLFCGG